MSVTTSLLTANFFEQDGDPYEKVKLEATLFGIDIEANQYVAFQTSFSFSDSSGTAQLLLFANMAGERLSYYRIKATAPNGTVISDSNVSIPNVPACNLADVEGNWSGEVFTGGIDAIVTGNLTVAGNTTLGDFIGNMVGGTIDPAILPAFPAPSDDLPLMDGFADPGTDLAYSRADHVHDSDLTKANLDLDNVFTSKQEFRPVDVTATIIVAKPAPINEAPELQIYGGIWNTELDDSEVQMGIRFTGDYVVQDTPLAAVTLNDAQVGSRVVVTGITTRGHAILGAEPPPVPDYENTVTNNVDVTIYNGGALPSPWIDITPNLVVGVDIPALKGSSNFQVLVENTSGNKAGEIEIGIAINGVDTLPANSVAYNITASSKQVYSNNIVNANLVPNGTTLKLQARAIAGSSGFTAFARNAERPAILTVNKAGTSVAALLFGGALSLDEYVDDAAAALGGVPINGWYRTGSIVKIRVS